jgi:hypothetical protein
MGFKLDRRVLLVVAGASGMAMSFLALPAVLGSFAKSVFCCHTAIIWH